MADAQISMLRRRACLAGLGAMALGTPLGTPLAAPAAARPVQVALLPERVNRDFVQPLFSLIAEGGGFDWDYQYVPWPRLLLLASRGEGLAWGLSPTGEHVGVYDYSDPVFTSGIWLIGRAGESETPSGYEGLKGRTLCLRRGLALGPRLEAGRGTMFQVAESDQGTESVLRMLAAGRCDRMLMTHRGTDPEDVVQRVAAAAPSGQRFFVERPPLATSTVHIAAAKGKPELAAQLQRVNLGLRKQAKAIQALVASDL